MDALSRRELLRAGALGAGGLLAGGGLLRGGAPAFGQAAAIAGGLRSELITVTPTGFACWWATSEASDTQITVRGPGLDGVTQTIERDRKVHVARIDGLLPGREYRYELRSGGRKVQENDAHTGVLTTLRQPTGKLLATIAVLNDIHVGEGCSGTISGDFPPCFKTPDYAIKMTGASIRAIRRLKPDLLVVNGDLTDRGRPDEMRHALNVIKRARVPYALTRGNHDRRFDGCGDDGDCMRMQAFPDRPAGAHALTWSRDIGPALTALEAVETAVLAVVKRSGVTEPFSREKVISGVRRACQGRQVDDDALNLLAQQVEDTVRAAGSPEVPSNEVGLAILGPLRELDEVAYLRFASVYRSFTSAEDFEREIEDLRAHRNVSPAL